ncbi:MAG: hypothetical protein ACE5I3_05175 [Phycisphaerae bacterium]
MPEAPKPTTRASPRLHTAQWVIAVLLAFIAGVLWSRKPGEIVPTAWAQTPPLLGARGVYAFTGQLDRNRFGLFMLDIEQGTIWCYEIDNVGGVRKLRLTAGRSWVYDRYLKDFNCASPSYREVQELVALQRATPPAAGTGAAAAADRDLPSMKVDSPDDR